MALRSKTLLAALFGSVLSAHSWAAWAAADAREPSTWQMRSLSPRSEPRLRISGGWFVLGSDDAEVARASALCSNQAAGTCDASQFAAERPARRIFVRTFDIDRVEVSNQAHQRCVRAGVCLPPRDPDVEPPANYPVVQLTFAEARAYCRFVGGDLPSEAQWEYAAHGSSERSFPWGQAWSSRLATFAKPDAGPSPVDANPDGKSFFGLLNMAGNVWEFVLDEFHAPYDVALPNVDPVALHAGMPGGEHVLRGGSFRSPPYMLRTRYRAPIRDDEARSDVGLRCAYEAR
jgi:formylglycine-generating enzyme required for sulfatase activity